MFAILSKKLNNCVRWKFTTSSDPWKNYPSASEGIFGFSWIIFSTDAKERAGFLTYLAARAPRSEELVDASKRKGEINYFEPHKGLEWFWTIPRGTQRCFWVLVKLWNPGYKNENNLVTRYDENWHIMTWKFYADKRG